MKKILIIVLIIILCFFAFPYNNFHGFTYSRAFGTTEISNSPKIVIDLTINKPYMLVNGISCEIDPGRGTKPVIISKWGRTVVPIRAIVEALGGTIKWNNEEKGVTISFNNTVLKLWINNPEAKVNNEKEWIDYYNPYVKPIIINSRTMLPLRFIAESFGCSVDWYPKTKTIEIKYPSDKHIIEFSIGTSKNVVLKIMGKPTNTLNSSFLNEEMWYYGISSITFKNGKVYEYNNVGGNLKVKLGEIKKKAPSINVGAIKQNVLDAMGTPTTINIFEFNNEEMWYYGISSITFKNGKVYEYNNVGGNLKVNKQKPQLNAPLIKRNSTKSDVIKSLGSPSSILKFPFLNTEIWYYGISSINFHNNFVYSWNNLGELSNHVIQVDYYNGNEENINYSEALPYSLQFIPTHSSLSSVLELPPSLKRIATIEDNNGISIPFYAENGSYWGQISNITGRPKTIYVRGYYRKDGTYVRSYFRSKPICP